MKKFFLLVGLFFYVAVVVYAQNFVKPIKIVVVVPSYNNGSSNRNICLSNLRSLAEQTYPYFVVCYTDDCSTDDTGKLVDEFVRQNHLENKFFVTHNTTRKGALENTYDMVRKIEGHKVVVVVDGDDSLAHPGVLQRIADVYKNPAVWLTFGNYKTYPNSLPSVCAPFPPWVMAKGAFRSYRWTASAPRTFYAKLFHYIQQKDLVWQDKFFSMAADLAYMFPMLEMASKGHIRFIPDILYLYYVANPINDFRVSLSLQLELDKIIRSYPPYQPLQSLFYRT